MHVLRSMALVITLVSCGCWTNARPPAIESEAVRQQTSNARLKFKDHNLVFVSFDAMQAAHVGAYGNPRNVTPTLDSFAKRGYSFGHVDSVASWTVPASMTWFTGVYPSEHRMTNKFAVYSPTAKKPANLKELSPNLMTLAEVLKGEGYATGGFTGNAGVSGGFGYDQGFDIYFYEKGRFGGFDRSIPRAIEWLKENKQKKFFLFLHGYDCHGQHMPSQGLDYRYVDDGYDHRFLGSEVEQETLREEGLAIGQLELRDSDIRFWRAVYDEKINRADARFNEFLSEFEKLGLSEKTLFVLTSDHGTELYEHRRLDHGFTLYEEQLHVPLIVTLPGYTEGKWIEDRVSSIDVMPTILDLLDVDPRKAKQNLRGRSLAPALAGDRIERDCFSETDYREYTFKRSIVRSDGWKLIFTLETKTHELYNLNTDPEETTKLAATETKLVKDLETRLFDHFKYIGCDLNSRRWEIGLNPVYSSQGETKK